MRFGALQFCCVTYVTDVPARRSEAPTCLRKSHREPRGQPRELHPTGNMGRHEANAAKASTLLVRAAASGDAGRVASLLQSTAATPSSITNVALLVAVQESQDAIVALLLQHAPATCVNSVQGASGCSLLYTAASKGHTGIISRLIERGASLDAVAPSGATPLYIACQQGQRAAAEVLLAAGANATLADRTGATPLYVACQNGMLAVVSLLLSRRAALAVGVNVPKATGATPLYVACQKGHVAVAAELISKSADVDARTATGASPLLVAALQGHSAAVNLLLLHGADPNLTTRDGTTPMLAACMLDAAPPPPPLVVPRLLLRARATVCEPDGSMNRSGLALLAAAERCADDELLELALASAAVATPSGSDVPTGEEEEQEEAEEQAAEVEVEASVLDVVAVEEEEEEWEEESEDDEEEELADGGEGEGEEGGWCECSESERLAADYALRAAMELGDLDDLRRQIEVHTHAASPSTLSDARMLRDKLRDKLRKAARQRRRLREAARAELACAHIRARAEAAEALQAAIALQELVHADGVDALRAALATAEASARVLQGHGAEARVRAAQERLRRLEEEAAVAEAAEAAARAAEAAGTSARETETVVGEAGRDDDSSATDIGTSTSEEEEEEEEEAAAATAQEAAATAAVHAAGVAASELDGKPSWRNMAGECAVCLDATNSHVLVPCGHKCVCAKCAELIRAHGNSCPICRTTVVWTCEVFE